MTECSGDFIAKLNLAVEVDYCKNILRAQEFSTNRIAQIRDVIQGSPEGEEGEAQGLGWVVTGSLGRLEALEASDVDLMLLVPPGLKADDFQNLDQAIRVRLRETLNIEVSKGENLTSPTSQEDIASPGRIGGDNDNVTFLTKRILLLTESRAVVRPESRLAFRDAIFRAYFERAQTKGRHLLSLINDLTRYYRTVCVDYKSRIDHEGKPFGARNMKLRHARKYWFFSTMMATVAAAARFEHNLDRAEKEAKLLLDRTPTERLLGSLEQANLLQHAVVICWYDRFLGLIGNPQVRTELESTNHAERYRSDAFREMKENSDNLHLAMLEIIEALPPHWQRHLLSHFLL